MAVVLEGGCRVSEMHEGIPEVNGSLKIWRQVGRTTGAKAISLRVLEFGPGLSPTIQNQVADEVFYNLEQIELKQAIAASCTLRIDGLLQKVTPQTGIYLRPGQTMTVENHGLSPVVFVSAQCPESGIEESGCHPQVQSAVPTSVSPIVRLTDKAVIPTANRWYRVLVDDEVGSKQVTQFVGSIPPGRAPDHFHEYEEVLFILRGKGRMWAGETNTLIGPGSCIYLPRRQMHCVENIGTDELRLLGVFYPAGSPAVRYEE